MNLLFVHANFPGQFLCLAPYLARHVASRTVFLTTSDNPQGIKFPGVEIEKFVPHRQPSKKIHPYLLNSESCVLNGQAVCKAVDQLIQNGFKPDVIIFHAGLGYGLYLKTLLPKVRLIAYVEWFFSPSTSQNLFPKFDLNDALITQTFNWPLMHELQESDDFVCPTQWQCEQFPSPWREKIHIIFDGVDTTCFYPAEPKTSLTLASGSVGNILHFEAHQRILSYATRGMEPLRGFPEFMRAAAFAQQSDPNVHVVIAGNDRVAYSYRSDHPSGSWKLKMLEELSGQFDMSRLHFVGLLNRGELAMLMRRSDLHCYFTRPYVVSWSVFEAAACGARLLVNLFPGLDEVLGKSPLVTPVDLDNQSALNAAVVKGLEMPRGIPLNLLPANMDVQSAFQKWLALLKG